MNMNQLLTKSRKLFFAILILSFIFMAVPVETKAATPYMKKMNVKWSLKPNKTVKYKTYFIGAGYKTQKMTLKNYKVTDADKKGYKQITFTAVNQLYVPNQSDLNKVASAWYQGKYNNTGGFYYCCLVDYKTGKSLWNRNKVSVSSPGWQCGGKTTTLYDYKGGRWQFYSTSTADYTITYPASYKNLCIIVSGCKEAMAFNENYDDRFDIGKCKFAKTSMSGKVKNMTYGMRVKGSSSSSKKKTSKKTTKKTSKVLASNFNIYGVENGPMTASTFTPSKDCVVTSILTYHWNYGKGKTPGTISIYENGKKVGSWKASGSKGQNGAANVNWTVKPKSLTLKKGHTYAIVDSDPETWSCNASSNLKGFFEIKGYYK